MSNQLIGIAGVFALTFFLFVIRHWFLSLGRANRSRYVNPTTPRRDRESDITSADDNAWLLWSPERDAQAGPPRSGFDEHRETRHPRLRS
jgi:hypothetical protein